MRSWRIALLCGVGMAWVVLTAARIHVWGHERTLWMEAIRHAPDKPRPWVNLGRSFQMDGAMPMAEWAYDEALKSATQRPEAEGRAAYAVIHVNRALGHGEPRLVGEAKWAAPVDTEIHTRYQWITSGLSR